VGFSLNMYFRGIKLNRIYFEFAFWSVEVTLKFRRGEYIFLRFTEVYLNQEDSWQVKQWRSNVKKLRN